MQIEAEVNLNSFIFVSKFEMSFSLNWNENKLQNQPKNSICALVRLRYNNRKIALNFRPSRGSRRSSFAEEASFITKL